MSDEIKKDIKKLLFLDSLISCTWGINKILDDVEDELEDIFGKPIKHDFDFEDLLKTKICK